MHWKQLFDEIFVDKRQVFLNFALETAMTRIIKILKDTAFNVNEMFDGVYQPQVTTPTNSDFLPTNFKIVVGFGADKEAIKSDFQKIGGDLRKGIEKATEEYSL
jgi:hypothetical protein